MTTRRRFGRRPRRRLTPKNTIRKTEHTSTGPTTGSLSKILYLLATAKRNSRENMTGKTNGWKTIVDTPTVHHGDRIADHIR